MLAPDIAPTGFGPHWLARLGTQATGDVVTFYSYKGGTGRSMALVNCAGLIAQHLPSGVKPILLIDFDLEAPGLHRYLAPYLPDASSGVGRQGVLELFAELRRQVDLALPAAMPAALSETPRLADDKVAALVDAVDLHDFIDDTRLGNLKLMTAGRFDDAYDRRVTRFDWEGLHTRAPALFRCLAERLSREYSFTFVDSRTGLSDTSGICTMLLPDVLVMVFTPNQQSLTGISHLVRKAVDYRNGAADTRALRVYPLPSRVDNQVEHFRRIWRMGTPQPHELFGVVTGYQPIFSEIFASALGMEDRGAERLNDYFDVVQVPHSADYSYGERLCFLSSASSDSLSVRGAYEQFLPWLVTGAQPWQRPADALLNQQAAAWLRDAGADTAPNEEGWAAWFDRLAGAVQTLPAAALARLSASPEHGFEMALTAALGMAWRDDLAGSTVCLKVAGETFDEALACTLPDGAPVALLRQWTERLTPAALGGADRKAWLAALEMPLRRWQTLKTQKMRWLSAVAGLADKAAWLDDERQALTELIAVSEEAVGGEHAQTLAAKSRLARTLHAAGLRGEARAIDEQLLDIRRRTLGEEHLDTLESMNNLAETLWAQGDLVGARELQQTALAVRRRVLGDEHPDTLTSMGNFAATLRAQGDLAGARELQQTALTASRRVLGDEHPATLTSMSNLAVTFGQQGELSAARSLHEQVAAGRQRSLGDQHPDTLVAKRFVAMAMFEQGETSAAIELQRQVLTIGQQVLGGSHAATLQMAGDLANMLRESGELEPALALYEEAFAAMSATLGTSDERTWSCAMALATVALELAQPERAAEVLDQFSEPRQTTDNASWVGLRLRVAERLSDRETMQRLNRRQYELLKPSSSALR